MNQSANCLQFPVCHAPFSADFQPTPARRAEGLGHLLAHRAAAPGGGALPLTGQFPDTGQGPSLSKLLYSNAYYHGNACYSVRSMDGLASLF